MADSFLYSENTENGYTNLVTADELNHIAIDLGIPDYSRFPEEPPQSAVSALNAITMDLTSKGILQIGSCMNVSVSDNVITVADGVCVMDNGAKKRLDEPVSLPCIEGGTNYVYILNNIAGNQIQIVNSLEAPAEDNDYVMLAEVNSVSVTDKRYWSISKVGNGVNVSKNITHSFVFLNRDEDGIDRYSEYEFDISQCGSNFFIFTSEDYTDNYPIAIALEEGKEVKHTLNPGYFPRESMFLKKEGAKLYIKTSLSTKNSGSRTYVISFWLA